LAACDARPDPRRPVGLDEPADPGGGTGLALPTTAPSALGTQLVLAPGLAYSGNWFQFGVEALVPRLHIFLDHLLPNSFGKPLANW